MFLQSFSLSHRVRRRVGLLFLLALVGFSVPVLADLNLDWTDNSNNESGFEIERSTDGTNFSSLASVGANVTSYTDATVINGTTYWYRVRAYNGAGNSGYTNVANAVAPAVNAAPTIGSIANVAITEGDADPVVNFTIGDAETNESSLTVQTATSNASLIPLSNIALGGSGASRSVTLTPESGQAGSATITITVGDGADSTDESFTFTVNPSGGGNTVPTISSIDDISITVGGTIDPVSFTISDAETALGALVVTAISSNTSMVPQSGINLSGTGGARTIAIAPSTGQTGTASITIEVSDGALSVSESFAVTVNAASGGGGGGGSGGGGSSSEPPSVTSISDVSVNEGAVVPDILFTVADPDNSDLGLIVEAISSNQDIVADSGLTVSGIGGDKRLRVALKSGASGSSTITVSVRDGQNTVTETFVLTVAEFGPPEITLHPFDADVLEGEETFLSILAVANPVPTYQWFFNDEPIEDAVDPTFGFLETELVHDGRYKVVVSNSEGSVTSNPAILDVEPAVRILSGPTSLILSGETEVTLSVEATGPNLRYQWYEGESGDTRNPISGANTATYTSPLLSNDSNYWVRVTTSSGGILLSAGDFKDSITAVLSFSAGYQFYMGSVVGSTQGDFAAAVRGDGSGVFMAKLSSGGSQSGEGVISVDFALDESGAFAFSTDLFGDVSGVVSDGGIQGSIGGQDGSFSANLTNPNGATSAFQGYYRANYIYAAEGEMKLLIGPDGEGFAIVEDENGLRGEIAIVDDEGEVSTVLNDSVLIAANVSDSSKIEADVTDAESGETIRLSGISDTTEEKKQLVNTSIRTVMKEGSDRMIAGFVVGGEPGETKSVLIRGVGPRLTDLGVEGAIADPRIELFRQNWDGTTELVAENDDWFRADNFLKASQASIAVGAFNLKLGSKDAALLIDLPVGVYSAHVVVPASDAGSALVEIYDGDVVDEDNPASNLSNISLLGEAGVGAEAIITGFVVKGNTPKRVLVRAVGPDLAALGVPDVLADPEITLFRVAWDGSSEVVMNNDDWGGSEIISEVSQQVGAFPLQSDSKSAAIVIWLEPGVYSAHASSVDGESGTAIMEVYDAPVK